MPEHRAVGGGLRFTVFGPVGLIVAGRRISVPRAQTRGVLALLALDAGRTLTYDGLVEGLWGGAPPPTARSQIHGSVSALRRLLAAHDAGEALVGGRFGYRLDCAPGDVDAGEFERLVALGGAQALPDPERAAGTLRTALRLWAGEPLADAAGAFVAGERARLTDRWLGAVEALAELDLGLGRHATVTTDLAPLVARHPFRERLLSVLMVALARGGRSAEALKSFREYRQALAEQEGLDPGEEIAALELAILRGSELPVGRPRARADVAMPAIWQLPADVVGFVGRQRELTALDRVVTDRDRGARPSAMCMVSGPPGVGKTALALRWAHRNADRFPDGILYADLRGDGATDALDPAVALERFLRELGAGDAPPTLAEGAARLRSELAGRRMLLFLDNAAQAAQVRPLLPGAGQSTVVITTRVRMDPLRVVDGVTQIGVDVLDGRESSALLRQNCPELSEASEADVAALAAACGGLPLALRILATLASGRQAMTPPALLAALRDEQRRLDHLSAAELGVSSSFALAYQGLAPDAMRLFRAFGLFPGSLPTAQALAAAMDTTVERVHGGMRQLAQLYLVQPDGERYRMHDLLRLYARRCADTEEGAQDRAVERCLAWYLAVATAADRLVRPAGPQIDPPDWLPGPASHDQPAFADGVHAVDWLDQELDNLVALVGLAGGTAPRQRQLAWRLAANLAGWLQLRAPLALWVNLNSLAVEAAAEEGHTLGEALLVNGLGIAHGHRRETSQAAAAFRRARRLRASMGDERGAIIALHNLGCLLADHGRPAEAVTTLEECHAAAVELGDTSLVPTVERNLGYALTEAGQWQDALVWLERARASARAAGDARTLGHGYLSMAEIHRNNGNLALAVEHYRHALSYVDRNGDQIHHAWALDGLGRALLGLGRTAAAIPMIESALRLYERIGEPKAEGLRVLLGAYSRDPRYPVGVHSV